MTNFEQLKETTQKLIKFDGNTSGKLGKDLTASVDGELFFLTNVFADSSLLGFWSHSPWGTTRDQEQGWVVLSKDLEVISSCETRTSGQNAGNDFRAWRRDQKLIHGRSFKLCPDWDNESFWKIEGL